ncbi:MAG: pantetheine-phosphate adenylyltransferase [Candidatus Azobacteroides sp.]|nr:pantetheine-phosphate adenylyltransferase [Candidatus Azobacteroides sp.]
MKKIAVFPGTFDPFTIGHEEIVKKALGLFDEVIIGVGINAQKTGLFSPANRIKIIKSVFAGESRVIVEEFNGLTVDFCIQKGAKYIVRGVRNLVDFSFERDMSLCNYDLAQIETVFFNSSSKYAHISSTLVRDIIKNNPSKAILFAPGNIDYTKYL